jgi:hypothetical protein
MVHAFIADPSAKCKQIKINLIQGHGLKLCFNISKIVKWEITGNVFFPSQTDS